MTEVTIKTRTVIGKGELLNIASLVGENEYTRIGLIIDRVFKADPYVQLAIENLQNAGHSLVTYYYDLPFEPDYESLDRVKYTFKDENTNTGLIDAIVAIGGGSVIDFAKGIATLINNHEPSLSYRGFPKKLNPSIPVIVAPTTAGTASEVTFNAVFTDKKSSRKLGINTHNNFPVLAILDSNLTKNCPYFVALSSGLDAMVHVFESFACKKANPYTRMFAKEGIKYLYNNIEKALKDPNDDQAREKMLFGAYLAGISLFNAGSGPAGAISYPLGVMFNIPHGIAGGFVLPYLVKHNVEKNYLEYSELYDVMEGADINLSSQEKAKDLVKKMFALYDKLEVWKEVKRFNVDTQKKEFVEYIGLLQGAFDQNPEPFTGTDAFGILEEIFNKN